MSDSKAGRAERAKAAHLAKNYVEAERLYLELLAVDSEDRDALTLIGILYAQTGREEKAAEFLSRSIKRDGLNFNALSWQAGVLATLGRFEESAVTSQSALQIKPDDYGTMLHLATARFGLEEYEDAAKAFMRAIKVAPKNLEAYTGLATTFLRLGNPEQARTVLKDAVSFSPDSDTRLKLGEVCLACDRSDEALLAVKPISASDDRYLDAVLLKCRAFRQSQDEVGEDEAILQALEISPNHALAHALQGRRLQSLGKFGEAEAAFLRSIALNPRQGVAYHGVTSGRKIVPDDSLLLTQMEQALGSRSLTDDEAAHLHYALGKSFENLGEFGAAMEQFDEGNRLMRKMRMGTRTFDRDAMTNQIENIERIFTKDVLAKGIESPHQDEQPIIVAGIMRSGTTLLEQILSRHPQIGAGGEQTFWRKMEAECVDYDRNTIDPGRLRTSAPEYIALLQKVAPGFSLITDKNPANRMVYGLIHLAFPESRIFHMQRHPVDVAISIYTTMIRSGAPFMGNRSDIVYALKMHKRLVRHWQNVLPASRFRVVSYEELVRSQERVTREVVRFLGLDWDDRCLSPEANERTVVTPSLWQVRQPVYTSSIERWKRYEPWLGSFAELLEDEPI
jgi:tetratricopeptide (TPR) repeat protein